MEKVLGRLKKDFRVVLALLLFVFMAFTWFKFSSSVDMDEYGDFSAGSSFNGFTCIQCSFLAILLYIIPIIFIITYFINSLSKYKKVIYPMGSLLGVAITLIDWFLIKHFLSAGDSAMEAMGVKNTYSMGIGVWLTLIDYLAILIYSLVFDFKISKDQIKKNGLKGVMSSVVNEVTEQTADLGKNLKNGEIVKNIQSEVAGTPCPKCGNTIALGKKFCKNCGYKLEENEQPAEADNTLETKSEEKKFDLKNIIKNPNSSACKYHGSICSKCGLVNAYTSEFCVDCGTKLVFYRVCNSCGANLVEGKQFCADCGAPIDFKKICKICGSEIWGHTKFCSKCGTEVDYRKTCKNCGSPVVEGKHFCPDCGKPYEF